MPLPIDKEYLVSSLKGFDSEVLSKKYLHDNEQLHEHNNKEVLDKLSISDNNTLLFDGNEIKSDSSSNPGLDLNNLPMNEKVNAEDRFIQQSLITDEGESPKTKEKLITAQNLANGLKNLMDFSDIVVPDDGSAAKVPFIYGYSVLVRDYDVNIPTKDRVIIGTLSDFSISTRDDIIDISALSMIDTTPFDISINSNSDIVLYNAAGGNWSNSRTETVRVCITIKDDKVDLPYIYGYKMITKDYEITLPSGKNSVTFGSLDDFNTNIDNMIDLSVLCITDNSAFDYTINNNSFQLISSSGGNWGTTKTVTVRVSVVVRDETKTPASALDISSLETVNTIEETDKFLINTGEEDARENKAITTPILANNMMNFMDFSKVAAPIMSGCKILTKEFEVTWSGKEVIICNILTDFGLESVDDMLTFTVMPIDNNVHYGTWFSFSPVNNYISAIYYSNITGTEKYKVSLIVRDSSSIPTPISVQNARVLSAVKSINGSGGKYIPVDLGVTFQDVFGETIDTEDIILITLQGINYANTFGNVCLLNSENQRLYTTYYDSLNFTDTPYKFTAIVKDESTKQLPRFVKDVEVTSTSGKCTLLTLDGSENCGGYTMDNFHSINVFPLTNAFGLDCVYLMNDNVITGLNRGTASGTVLHHKFRIMIE